MNKEEKLLNEAIENRYVFKPYSKKLKKAFLSEKKFLSRILSKIVGVEIHHIGSTSVEGLGGKGIIDIIVIVPKKSVTKAKRILVKNGFLYKSKMRERTFHSKYYVDYKMVPKLIHLHLTHHGSGELEIALSFVEYLRAHKKARLSYQNLKQRASKLYSADSKEYTEYKRKFVESTLKKALKWYKSKII
jgi:GrpB-like predicted nucleotidyltransferase (UPF0157 family)